MLKLSIIIDGKTTDDLETALEEVLRLVRGDYKSGKDSNEDGSFTFHVSGEEVAKKLEDGDDDDRYMSFHDVKKLYYVDGMETWKGDDIADGFNQAHEMQIKYVGDSMWEVVTV